MCGTALRGALAGAAGTTALNAVTYLDMALRARPASTSPERTVRELEERGLRLPDAGEDEAKADNRRSGLGALLGIAAGLGTGVLYAYARENWPRGPWLLMAIGAGVGANVGSTAPMVALGVTDPREWSTESWLMDVVPHLAYGFATALTHELFDC